ncbi:putative glutathione S-transferase GliG-like protein [Jackrogersella minutella]|nr:putative glutathione S-transferase GliG-like protein [Jackrogersella minutella]
MTVTKVNASDVKNGEVVIGNPKYDGRLIIYVIKADETSYINYMKPLILAAELRVPHCLAVIDTHEQWFYSVHPERYVPALRDRDPVTGEDFNVFESTACLQYIADRWDKSGEWTGRSAREKGAIMSWTEYQTAGIGATAKYWLYFARGYPTRANPVQLPRTIEKFHSNTLKQWDVLEKQLSRPGQNYIALPDRPTLADMSYLPFAMPWMFTFLGVDIKDWPMTKQWAERMLDRPAVKEVLQMAPKIGH